MASAPTAKFWEPPASAPATPDFQRLRLQSIGGSEGEDEVHEPEADPEVDVKGL
jgi:hypothetical protein